MIQLNYGLRNMDVQFRIHKGSPIIAILSRINPITRIDTYVFKVSLLPSSILATFPVHLNLLDLTTLTILDERYKRFLIVQPPLPILVPLGLKYWTHAAKCGAGSIRVREEFSVSLRDRCQRRSWIIWVWIATDFIDNPDLESQERPWDSTCWPRHP